MRYFLVFPSRINLPLRLTKPCGYAIISPGDINEKVFCIHHDAFACVALRGAVCLRSARGGLRVRRRTGRHSVLVQHVGRGYGHLQRGRRAGELWRRYRDRAARLHADARHFRARLHFGQRVFALGLHGVWQLDLRQDGRLHALSRGEVDRRRRRPRRHDGQHRRHPAVQRRRRAERRAISALRRLAVPHPPPVGDL